MGERDRLGREVVGERDPRLRIADVEVDEPTTDLGRDTLAVRVVDVDDDDRCAVRGESPRAWPRPRPMRPR